MATPGQSVRDAMVSGFEGARAHKQALSDQEFLERHHEIQGQIDNLNTKLSNIQDKTTPDYLQAKDALAQAIQARDEHWHPAKNPGALQKFGHLLVGKKIQPPLVVAPPVYGQPTMDVNGEKVPTGPAYKVQGPQSLAQLKAQAEAVRMASAAAPSLEQQATLQANAQNVGTLAAVQGEMKAYNTLYPDASDEEKQAHLNDLIQKHYGITGAGNWTNIVGKMNGQPVTLLFDKKTRQYRQQNGESIPPDMMATFVPSVTETPNMLQVTQYNEDIKSGKFKGSYPEWLKVKRSGTELKYDAATEMISDLMSGTKYSEGDPNNTPEVNAMFKGIARMTAKKQAFQLELAKSGRATFNMTRPMNIYDTQNGNSPGTVTFEEMRKNPTRYLPAGPTDKALAKENLMADIAGTSQATRDAINALTPEEEFTPDMKLKIAVALSSDHPGSAIDSLVATGAISSLTDNQQNFLIRTRQLAENAMAMRTILGAGQGSEDMRNAIRDTLPSLLGPNKDYALRQLDAFDQTIARLHRGVPKVPLRTDISVGYGDNSSANKGKKRHSLSAAMKLPFNKGKSEAQVRSEMEGFGYEVTP